MKCASCSHPMIVLELDSVEVDHCTACGSVWLDAGELERLLGRKDLSGFLNAFAPVKSGQKAIKCPICFKRMKKAAAGGAGGVEVDLCAKDGIWCDRGELEALLRLGSVGGETRVAGLLKDMFGKQR